jgi:hypothetical protein
VRIDGVEQRSVGVEKRCNEVEEQSDGAVERSDGVVDWRRGETMGATLGAVVSSEADSGRDCGHFLSPVSHCLSFLAPLDPPAAFRCRKIADFELIFPSLTQAVGRNAD